MQIATIGGCNSLLIKTGLARQPAGFFSWSSLERAVRSQKSPRLSGGN